MRCFIAIDIDDDAIAAIADLQQELRRLSGSRRGDVKWVQPEAMHLTLKFMGEITDEQAAEVCAAVKRVAAKHKRFCFEPRRVGNFGGEAVRVVWLGIESADDALEKLQSYLDGELEAAGFARDERSFSAHLTICRVRGARAGIKLGRICEQYNDFSAGAVAANAIVVYQSELSAEGATYTVLAKEYLQ